MKKPSIAIFIAAWIAGCGAHAHYQNGVYEGDTRFRVDPPGEPFRRVDVEDANDLAWAGEGGVVIQVNGSCDPDLDIPLAALTNHLLIGFTEREFVEEQSLHEMDGREALHTHVRAKLDGVPRELYLVVTKKDECVYDFALVAPPGARFDAARATFDRMLASFASETRR